MIFDRLWRAERKDAKALKELRQKYKPELDAAEKKGWEDQQGELSAYRFETDLINGAECLRTELLVKKARRLGVAVPPHPPRYEENDSWNFNRSTGDQTLSTEAESRLTREIRKEEIERLQHQMRWVSQVAIPVIGLIGSLMGLISLIHALRK
jgi:biopolymer transport protein ExbB/TolQ